MDDRFSLPLKASKKKDVEIMLDNALNVLLIGLERLNCSSKKSFTISSLFNHENVLP